jgi:hypothetical protein
MSELTNKPEHVDVEAFRKAEPSDNPVARGLNVTVSIPETVEIRMVDASVLSEYELWFFLASLLSNAAIGFLVAYLQTQTDKSLLANTLIFGLLFLITLITALLRRKKLRQKAKTIQLKATEAVAAVKSSEDKL